MDGKTYVELEAAAFEAWPALQPDEIFLGWRLRYSGGATKRINSANSGLQAADLTREQISEVEDRYRQRGLPAIFRITSVATPSRIDGVLEERGYRYVDPTWVMTLPMRDAGSSSAPLCALGADAWVDGYRHITTAGAPHLSTHLRMIQSGNDACALAVEHVQGMPASCGIGVIRSRKLGLFALATAHAHQRKGLATTLCEKLLTWGHAQGAEDGYLQVTKANIGAISIYEKLGFKPAYSYWYRVSA